MLHGPVLRGMAAALVLLAVLAVPALAEPVADAAGGAEPDEEAKPVAIALLIAVFWLGVGGAITLLRVILPGLATSADASAGRLGSRRLVVGGVLPLIGAGLIGAALDTVDVEALNVAYGLLVLIPLCLAALAGAMGAVPRIGGKVLKDGAEAGELKRGLVGGLVLGLASVTLVIPPLGALVLFLVLAWLVGIGVGTVLRVREPAA